MPLLCKGRMRDAIANQLINKLSRSIKSIHLMEVIFGILIPGCYMDRVEWILQFIRQLNTFCREDCRVSLVRREGALMKVLKSL